MNRMKKYKKMRIATYLVNEGFLSLEQAKIVMDEQKKMNGNFKNRFGRIAVNKGFINEHILNKALIQKEKYEFGFKINNK